MDTLIAHFCSQSRRPKGFLYALVSLLSFIGLVVVLFSYDVAFAARVLHQSTNQSFSVQARLGINAGDDWEPSITADRFGHVYALYKHYDVPGGQTCTGCNLHLLVQRSNDDGLTWGAPRPIAPIAVKGGQYDPQIVGDPVDGRTVWATFMQNSKAEIDVVKSSDFGGTWSAPIAVSHRPPGLDKDELAVRGNKIVVGYDDNFNTWASISLDGGKSWKTHEVFPTSSQFSISLAAGAGIDSKGNIFISWDSYDKAHRKAGHGPVPLWVSKSSDNGLHWTRTIVDVSGGAAPLCNNCGYDFLSSQMALRIGSDDTIYLLWNASVDSINFSPERIYFSRSTDHGLTYSPRSDISDAPIGVEHCFPAIAVGKRPGDVRLGWMDTRTGKWNVFYRASTDGGLHLSPTIRISSYIPGYPYLTPTGFGLPYGDYFSMAVDDDNTTQMAFGEAPSYSGPGNIWTSHGLHN